MKNLMPFNRKNRDLSTEFEDFYDLMENFFSNPSATIKGSGKSFKLDVQETDDTYFVEAEMPGAKKEELDVELKDNRLTISVKREEKVDEEGKNYIHRERRSSSMQRSIYLPDSKSEGVKAKLEDGLLSVTVPKEADTSDKIKVKID